MDWPVCVGDRGETIGAAGVALDASNLADGEYTVVAHREAESSVAAHAAGKERQPQNLASREPDNMGKALEEVAVDDGNLDCQRK